jgi:alkaline phosphatase
MTDKAIDILDNDRDGFFLMVESGRIDHGHHAGNAFRALEDTRAFADAVRTAYENTDPRETLIIVTADHGHVFTIAGYPTRGNPILGKVVGNDSSGLPNTEPTLAKDGLPYTTVAYANGRGFADLEVGGDTHYGVDIATGRHDLSGVDTEGQGFHQEALVPMSSETHSAEDVAVYASGPWGFLFQRTQEQNYLYHVMRHAAKIDQKRDRHPRRY